MVIDLPAAGARAPRWRPSSSAAPAGAAALAARRRGGPDPGPDPARAAWVRSEPDRLYQRAQAEARAGQYDLAAATLGRLDRTPARRRTFACCGAGGRARAGPKRR